jgi:hypothetical protein
MGEINEEVGRKALGGLTPPQKSDESHAQQAKERTHESTEPI